MSGRFSTVYVGRVDSRTRERDLYDIFDRYGRVARVDMKRGFAFVDFDDNRDAEDAIKDMDGREVDGSRITVEWAGRGRGGGRDGGRDGGRGGGDRGGGGGGGRDGDERRRAGQRPDHSDHRIKLEDIPSSAHWQDLKDFCRKAGDVIFGDVDRRGGGVVEFRYAEDVERAVRELDGANWNGHKVRVTDDSKNPASKRGGRSRSRSPRGRSRSPRRAGSRSRSPKKSRSRSPKKSGSPRSGSHSPKKSRSPSPAKDEKNGDDRSPSPAKADS